MLVIFVDRSSAINCANALHSHWFNEKQLKVVLFLPAVAVATTADISKSEIDNVVNSATPVDQSQDFDLDNFFNNLKI